MPKLRQIRVNLSFPGVGGIEGTWAPDDSERRAAWELYVELVTRISVAELRPDEGLLREALSSLYSFFNTTRTILRTYGPTVAQVKDGSQLSFGYVAVAVLNTVLRPTLAHWHPRLLEYEHLRPNTTSLLEHERSWEYASALRDELNQVRLVLIDYANLLADVAEVPSLIIDRPQDVSGA